jgi:mono/diheme cytochrome c family protein
MISRQVTRLILIAGAVAAFETSFLAASSATGGSHPTFNSDVAPILFKHCANCHRSGEIAAAMPLVSYDNARAQAESIKETVLHRQMPPWPADPNQSLKFRNDPRLSQKEIDTLVAWVNGGTPKGNDADLPPMPVAQQGWLHPEGLAPDLVISLPTFHIPASGEIPYVKYLAKVPAPDGKWVVAIQVRPSNRAVVHHMAITEVALKDGLTPANLEQFIQAARALGVPFTGVRPAVVDPTDPQVYDMLGVYTPGTTFEMYGDGDAKLLKGGENMYLDFNIHYQTTGKPETDQPTIAFWFQPEPPKHQLYRVPAAEQTIIANGNELLTDAPGQKAEGTSVAIPPIPAYAENYEVIGITAYTTPVTIYQFQPHAHLRGKDFKYAVVYPDGREETVLSVPKYEFHWQLAYDLDQPLKLPAGSKLVVTAHYDNSLKNEALRHHHDMGDPAHAPSPEKEVYFREMNNSWDEMFTPFIQYSIDNQDPSKPTQPEPLQRVNARAGGRAEPPERDTLDVVEVVGCLKQSHSSTWMLTRAGDPIVSASRSTSSVELKAAAGKPLGNQQYQLLGVSVFNPSTSKTEKVAVKGVLLKDSGTTRLNVTSLQTVGAGCL